MVSVQFPLFVPICYKSEPFLELNSYLLFSHSALGCFLPAPTPFPPGPHVYTRLRARTIIPEVMRTPRPLRFWRTLFSFHSSVALIVHSIFPKEHTKCIDNNADSGQFRIPTLQEKNCCRSSPLSKGGIDNFFPPSVLLPRSVNAAHWYTLLLFLVDFVNRLCVSENV